MLSTLGQLSKFCALIYECLLKANFFSRLKLFYALEIHFAPKVCRREWKILHKLCRTFFTEFLLTRNKKFAQLWEMNFKLALNDIARKTIRHQQEQKSSAVKRWREIVYHKYQEKIVYQISAATTIGVIKGNLYHFIISSTWEPWSKGSITVKHNTSDVFIFLTCAAVVSHDLLRHNSLWSTKYH